MKNKISKIFENFLKNSNPRPTLTPIYSYYTSTKLQNMYARFLKLAAKK